MKSAAAGGGWARLGRRGHCQAKELVPANDCESFAGGSLQVTFEFDCRSQASLLLVIATQEIHHSGVKIS